MDAKATAHKAWLEVLAQDKADKIEDPQTNGAPRIAKKQATNGPRDEDGAHTKDGKKVYHRDDGGEQKGIIDPDKEKPHKQ